MLSSKDLESLNADLVKTPDARRATLNQFGGLDKLFSRLSTTLEGIGSDAAQVRVDVYGSNEMPERRQRTFLGLLKERLADVTMIILCVSAVVSLVLGILFPETFYDDSCSCVVTDKTGWVEGVAILVAVALVSLVGAGQDYDKELKFRALGKADIRYVKVIRNGSPIEIKTESVVVGDIVELEAGKRVPADGVVVAADELLIDESMLTGESNPKTKFSANLDSLDDTEDSTLVSANSKSVDDKDDILVLGSTIVSMGRGRMLVTSTGRSTFWGAMLADLQVADPGETPLQMILSEMVILITKFGLVMGVLSFEILAVYWAIATADLISQTAWDTSYVRGLVEALVIGITLMVVSIPEGLPLAVIISLAYSVKAMTRDGVLVRHLEACETMGGASNICSDKTGTLTMNRMTVVDGWFGGDGAIDKYRAAASEGEFHSLLRASIVLNTTALRQEGKVVGFPTEMALIDFCRDEGESEDFYVSMRKNEEGNLISQIPFSSKTKRMSTLVHVPDEGCIRIYVKGAPDQLIPQCSKAMMLDGSVRDASSSDAQREMQDTVERFSKKGFRTMIVAYRDVAGEDEAAAIKAAKEPSDYIAIAILALEDPVRPEVPQAVLRCHEAGITVRMITGDYLGTAVKIAEQCGIKTANGTAMSGPEFRSLSDEEIDRVIPQLQVLARCMPSDKLRLVQRLRALNQIVAVTGDGTNDAPALKEADVGLAMGLAGTDVAKEASDIIITDDNFSSIVQAVKWGRNVFKSVRKFLQFQLTVNLVATALVFIGAVTNYGTPLRAVQLLWINLIMDTLAALALATEPPTETLLNNPPRGREEPIINNVMWRNIAGHVLYQLAVSLALVYAGDLIPWTTGRVVRQSRAHYTIVFNAFVWCQLFNEINARSVDDDHQGVFKGVLQSYIFVIVVLASVALQVIIVQFGGDAFKVVPLSWDQWLFCVGIGSLELVVGFILRSGCIPVPETPFAVLFRQKCFGKRNEARVQHEESRPLLAEVINEA